MSRAARLAREWAPPLLLLAAAVAGWEVAARAGWVEDYLLPAPSEVARALVDDRKLLLEDAWVTAQEVLLGFALALVVGVAIAVALHVSGLLRRAVYPLVVASQAVPVVVIAPILVIWFGFGMTPKLIVIALICFFPIVVNTLDGLRAVDPAQAKMLRTLGADRWALLRRLELPVRAPVLLLGREGRGRGRRDRSRVRRAGRLRRGARPRHPGGHGPAPHGARLRRGGHPLGDGDRALRSRFGRGAARRAVGRAPEGAGVRAWRRAALAAIVLAIAMLGTACGEKSEDVSGTPDQRQLDLTLDWFPNPDHVAIYEAQSQGYFRDVGLDVRPRVPSDPSAPIKQVAAGRTDLAISYRAGGFLARKQGLPVVAVAALVQRPLTSVMATRKSGVRSVRDLRGKRVGTAGIPYQSAYLKTILARANVPASSVKETNVGASLLAAMLSGKVDATLGAFWNVEGVELRQRRQRPWIAPVDRLGVPDYDELVLVATRTTSRTSATTCACSSRRSRGGRARPARTRPPRPGT